ncbi:MAG: ferrochelatase [Candidatus Nitrohelix vancouverensis]|uniref:Ferrochelatase n=1 Tax=Candidatus Nitrohelix vancouverensis TaxID=2705534 RepID=A0A7T0C598_9BACT|nr:MAG: ferrochelatase [Candidatus Nitrohelix vancouverensis]
MGEPETGAPVGIFLMAHGAPNSVDDIPQYLKNIRGGKESSDKLVQIISDRYTAIGGSSPLLEITTGQVEALEKFLNQGEDRFKVYVGMRNWSPFIQDAVQQMLDDGVRKVVVMCLAPQYSSWSTELYFKAFRTALEVCGSPDIDARYVGSWADNPLLIDAFAERYKAAEERLRGMGKEKIYTVFTAHSIPAQSLDNGDPYAEEYAKTLNALVERVQPQRWFQAYQSQGMIPVPWLGPTVEATLDKIARYGSRTVLMVPIGFVCDHVEILYDIDIEFKKYADERKLDLHRTESLNLSPLFTEALAAVAWEHLL